MKTKYSLSERIKKATDPDELLKDFCDVSSLMSRSQHEMEMYEEYGKLVVRLKASGFAEKEIDVAVEGESLVISGEKEQSKSSEKADRSYYFSEMTFEKFSRVVELPRGVDTESVKASYQDGLVTVSFTKNPVEKQKVRFE
jgi:HSP20 family protein